MSTEQKLLLICSHFQKSQCIIHVQSDFIFCHRFFFFPQRLPVGCIQYLMLYLATLSTKMHPETCSALRFCIISEYTPGGFPRSLFRRANSGHSCTVNTSRIQFMYSGTSAKRPNLRYPIYSGLYFYTGSFQA